MRIGIDTRLLSRPITGIGRYVLEITRSLALDKHVTPFLYSPSRIAASLRPQLRGSKMRWMNLEAGWLRQLWTETVLPLWARRDDVDLFWGPAHRLPRWLPLKMARVLTIHDLAWKYVPDTMRPLSRLLEKIQMPPAIRDADHIVAVSHATASAIMDEFHIAPDKLSVIPPVIGRPKPFIDLRRLSSIGIRQPYFLFVGTLEPRKNLAKLLAAYATLPEAVKTRALPVIAGGRGWGGVNLERTVAQLNIGRYVKLPGYVDEQTLAALYSGALFVAMPSLYEGFGLPLAEAMAYGKPVLTSNTSSMTEVAGDAGLYIDPHDVGSIAAGLQQMIADPERRNQLAAHAKNKAAGYRRDITIRQLTVVFEKAVRERRRRML